MPIYEKNIQALVKINPLLASRLIGIEGNQRFDIYQDPKDPLNVNIVDREFTTPLFKGVPRDEILAKVDQFEETFSRYPVLFLYGIANGLFVKLLLQNTNHNYLIVIEPEIELLYIVFNLIDFTQELNEGRIFFFLDHEIDFVSAVGIFSDSAIKVFCKTYHLEPTLEYYELFYGESMLQCNTNMIRAIEHVLTGLGNDTTDALIGLEWHLANMHKMVQTPTLLELIQKAKTTEIAIIISTGPSLAKQLPLLKTIKEHVTLLSVDASLPILEKYDIKPDIVFSIERIAATAEFYQRTSREFQEGIVCAMSSLAHPALVESVNGATLQMSMRPFGYTRYFDLPEYGYLGIGMSAANMAYELAYHAKFKTIILIGQDLAYGKEGQSHSEGHVFGSLKGRESDFMIEAYGGNGEVQTSVIWNMFRNFFENDIHEANKEGVVTINATEGGARIHGAIEMKFTQVADQVVDKSILKQRIELDQPDTETIAVKTAVIEEKVAFLERYVETMQKKVSSLFENVARECEELDRLNAKENLQAVDYDTLAVLMHEIDEIKSKFDEDEFVDIFIDATQALIVHHELEIAQLQVRAIKDDDDRRLKMIDWVYAHRSWLFALAGIMEAELVAIKRRGSQSRFVHEAKLDDSGDSIIGYFYDFSQQDSHFEIDLMVDNEIVVSKALDIVYPQKGHFTFSIPSRFYNDQVHDIMVREKRTGIVLSGMPDRRLFLSANRSKAAFIESLDQIDAEMLKDSYCKDAIGFLAVKENLENEKFVRYIHELIRRFPQITCKAFCFDEIQDKRIKEKFGGEIDRFKIIKPKNIYDIAREIEIFIWDWNHLIDRTLLYKFLEYSSHIWSAHSYMTGSIINLQKISLDAFDKIVDNDLILRYPHEVGFSDDEIKRYGKSYHKLVYNSLMQRIGYTDFNIELNVLASEFLNFELISLLLHYPKFKQEFIKVHTKRYKLKLL